jgi:opacity protein-like surface antigen
MSARWRAPTWKCLLIACGIGLIGSAPARAQQYKRFESGVFVGGMSVSHDLGTVDNILFTTTGAADNVSFGDLLGFRFSYDFSPNLAAEANYSRAKETFSFRINDDDIGAVDLADQFDATVQNISGNLVGQFPLENGLIPYGTIGFAWVRTDLSSEIGGVTDDSSTGLNLGGGVKYFFTSWVGARFDLRYQIISQGLAFADNAAEPRNTEFTIGAAFRF